MSSTILFMLSVAVAQITPGDQTRSVDVGGTPREYVIHIPTGYDAAKPHPLVLIFHGYKENPATMASDTGLNDKSDQAGFIAVYPSGSGNPLSWNAGTCCNTSASDVEFVKELLKDIDSVANVDSKRVYAVGMSNGAMMANRLACELPDRIAAIGTVAGTRMIEPCSPNRAMPVVHFHGTSDGVIPFNGGGVLQVPSKSVTDHIAFWVMNNKAVVTAQESVLSTSPMKVTQKLHLSNGANSAEVVLIEIQGGGHLWPGQPRPARFSDPKFKFLLGETTPNVSANDVMWDFFKRHELP